MIIGSYQTPPWLCMQLLLLMASPMFGVFFEFIQMTRSIYVSARVFLPFLFFVGVEKVVVTPRTDSQACGINGAQGIRWERCVFQVPWHLRLHISMTFVSGQKSHYRGAILVAGGLWSIEVHVCLMLETISDIFTRSNPTALTPQPADLPVQ